MTTKFSGPVIFDSLSIGGAEAALSSGFGWSLTGYSTAGGATRLLAAGETTAADIAVTLGTLLMDLTAKGIIDCTDDDLV